MVIISTSYPAFDKIFSMRNPEIFFVFLSTTIRVLLPFVTRWHIPWISSDVSCPTRTSLGNIIVLNFVNRSIFLHQGKPLV